MSKVLRALAGLILALFSGCNHSGRGSSGGDGGPVPDAGCAEGSHSCANGAWLTCAQGVYGSPMACPTDQVCSAEHGCTPCLPGKGACRGDEIVECNENGYPGDKLTGTCLPLTCAVDPATGDAQCVEPCDPMILARSYTGCVFYATDLPQFTIPEPGGFGTIAADQQFAVVVANPWPVPIDVTVERDDAPPAATLKLAVVMKDTVPKGGLTVLKLPQREVSGYVKGSKRNRSLLSTTAYRVTTSRPASVYQFNPLNNPDSYSNDASLLMPANALDASYVVLGWPGFGGDVMFGGLTIMTDKRSFVTVVGTRAGTKLRITPSTEVMAGDNVPAMHKGKSYTFTLNEFDTLNLEGADFAQAGATDFTGTRIEANGPLAVWSGVECTTINPDPPLDPMKTCCCDHLEEQLFPRSSLGLDYVVVRSEARDHRAADPEFFRVMALEDATDVKTSLDPPNDRFTLAAGAMREVMTRDDFTVSATKAVMIGQFQTSMDASAAETGDPSFELVPPVAQHRSKYIFLVPSGYAESWLLISIPAGVDVNLDGQVPVACERVTAGMVKGKPYDAVRCPLTAGSHTISSMANFGLVVEGWGPGPVSYGYTGGMEFKTVNHDCSMDGDCPEAEFCSGGVCAPIIQ